MEQAQFAPRLFRTRSLGAMLPPDHLLRRLEAEREALDGGSK